MASAFSKPNPLPVLAAGRWISTGRVLNYERWDERDRFIELDHLIIQVAEGERLRNQERQMRMREEIAA